MRIILAIIISISTILNVHSQNDYQNAIQSFVSQSVLKHASISFCLIDIKNGKIIASHNPDLSLIPASSLKTVTTGTALSLLGKDFQFQTLLQYDGIIKDSILDGNIYIKGFGDPTLGSDQMPNNPDLNSILDIFAEQIQKLGIKIINGEIIADATYFESRATAPTWMYYDIGNYYGAGAYGLNVNENLYKIIFQQKNKIGETPAIISIQPEIPDLHFINELQTAGPHSGDNAYIYGVPYHSNYFLRGTLPKGNSTFKIKGSIPNPPLFLAQSLTHTLENINISVCESPTAPFEIPYVKRTTFYTHYSPKLIDIIHRTNLKSINLFAECIMKELGKGYRENGIKKTIEYWRTQGLDMDGFHLEDGSGLSPRNAVSSKHLANILRKMGFHPDFQAYLSSFPTLQEGLYAKSGYMDRVRSYTGYIFKNGKEYCYSFIVNNYDEENKNVKKWMQKLLREI